MEHTRLDNVLHVPQEANIVPERLRIAEFYVRLNARPADECSQQVAGLARLVGDGHVVLNTPPVADASEVGRRVKRLGLELPELRRKGLFGGVVQVRGEEEREHLDDGGLFQDGGRPRVRGDVLDVALVPVEVLSQGFADGLMVSLGNGVS